METDRPMVRDAYVIERVANGVIVRPHVAWWDPDRGGHVAHDSFEVRVFSSVEAFTAWAFSIFPGAGPQRAPAAGFGATLPHVPSGKI